MITSEPMIILDTLDCQRILNVLYKGKRPEHVHTLLCSCGATADLRKNPCAWNKWMILSHPRCPECLARESACQLDREPVQARERYFGLVGQLVMEKEG